MSRGLPAAMLTSADGTVVRPVVFVELGFDAPVGTMYVHDDVGDLTGEDWDGVSRTWEGLGDLGGVEGVEEGEEISPYALSFTLSGIDADIASTVLTDDTVLRTVRVLLGFRDSDRSLVSQPHPWWSGQINDQQVLVGPESVIRVTAESRMIAFEEVNGRKFNEADQQEQHPGDLGLQYLEQMSDAKIKWGGDEKTFRTGSGGTGFFRVGEGGGTGSFRQGGRNWRQR